MPDHASWYVVKKPNVRPNLQTGMHLTSQLYDIIYNILYNTYYINPGCNFLYKIAKVKLGNMVRFRALLCLGVPTQCQRLQFYRGPWCQRFYRDFMLKTG